MDTRQKVRKTEREDDLAPGRAHQLEPYNRRNGTRKQNHPHHRHQVAAARVTLHPPRLLHIAARGAEEAVPIHHDLGDRGAQLGQVALAGVAAPPAVAAPVVVAVRSLSGSVPNKIKQHKSCDVALLQIHFKHTFIHTNYFFSQSINQH